MAAILRSCHADSLYKILFPLPKDVPHEAGLLIGQGVSEDKIFEIVDDNAHDNNVLTPEHGHA